MAVVTIKSLMITNRDSTPSKLSNDTINGGISRSAVGVAAVGTADSATSRYVFCSIPSNARVNSVKLYSDANTGANMACTLDLWDTTANGGAVVKAGFFASSLDPSTAFSAKDCTYTSSGANTALQGAAEKTVWDLLGLSSDPNKFYDVCLVSTVNNNTTGANVVCKVEYVV